MQGTTIHRPDQLLATAATVRDGSRSGAHYTAVQHPDGWRIILRPSDVVLPGGPWESLRSASLRIPRVRGSVRACEVPDCPRKHHAKGLCRTHAKRRERTGSAHADVPIRPANGGRLPRRDGCRVPGCPDEHDAKGFCKRHYDRWREHGDYDVRPRREPVERCRWTGVEVAETCERAATGGCGYCSQHYQAARFHRLLPDVPECRHPGCRQGVSAKGLCRNHYYSSRRRPQARDTNRGAAAVSAA